MKNVFFVTISLDHMAGGLEKNLINISNLLSKKKYKINILTFDLNNSHSFYKIRKEINWYKVGISKPHLRYNFFNKIKLIYLIRKIFKKSNKQNTKVICFHHGILPRIFLSAIGLPNIQILCSERNSLSIYKYVKKNKFNLGFFLLFFVKKIIIQFSEYKNNYPKIYQNKILTINNIIDKSNIENDSKKKIILNIGRLSTQKKQIDLIKIFEKIAPKCPDWHLKIIGDGDLKILLTNYINQSKYKSQIKIVQPRADLSTIYAEASIFCLTSQWEGFPNSLAEALSAKIPSICFERCEGANILIEDGYNGFKVIDNEEFSEKLLLLIRDKNLLNQLSINASRISDKYQREKIIKKWEILINEK
jgi:glycosyltransferase involved in cell wall biosynthesis